MRVRPLRFVVIAGLVAGALSVGALSAAAAGSDTGACSPRVGTVTEHLFYEVMNDSDVYDLEDTLDNFAGDMAGRISYLREQLESDIAEGYLVPGDVENSVAFLEDVLPSRYDDFLAKAAIVKAQLEVDGGMTAANAKLLLDAEYELKMSTYNGMVDAYNADKLYLQGPYTSFPQHFAQRGFVNESASYAYYFLGRSYMTMLGDPGSLAGIYDSTLARLLSSGLDEAGARELTALSMREAVEGWVEQVDLDYFTGYQIQVEQYLEMATAAGYVRDLDSGDIVVAGGQPNTRALGILDLEDLPFDLTRPFLMLDAEGNFISPQAMYESSLVQSMVADVMSPLDQLTDPTDKSAFLGAVAAALFQQYEYLQEGGATAQPVGQVLPSFMEELMVAYDQLNQDRLQRGEETLPLPRIPDWKDRAVVPGELPFDTYRVNNYTTVPTLYVTTVSREIGYLFEDGSPAADAVTQSVSYQCIDGGRYFVDGVDSFAAVSHPSVTYDGATVLDPAVTVGEEAVTATTDDSTITVTYPLRFEVTVNLVDTQGVSIASPLRLAGRWGTPLDQAAPSIDGYVVRGPGSIQKTFGSDRGPFQFVYERAATSEPTVVPTITDPADQTVAAGKKAMFRVMATGVPIPTITWQVATDGAVTWRAITADPAATPSEDGKTLTVVGGPANDGNLYRAIASNAAGAATSMAAELSVTAPDTGTTDDPDTGLPVTGSGSLTFALLGAALLLLAGGGVLLRIRGQNNKPDDSEAPAPR